jgi:hypothetical protein
MTYFQRVPSDGDGPSLPVPDAEAQLWAYLEPYKDVSFWLQAQPLFPDPTKPALGYPYSRHDTASDDPAAFYITDKMIGRRFVTAPAQNSGLRRALDSSTAKYMFQNGPSIGGLVLPSNIVAGKEVGNPNFFNPGTGYTAVIVHRTPTPSTTLHGVAYGSSTGGVFFGGSSPVTTDDLCIGIDQSSGRLQVQNRRGTMSFQDPAGDLRDAARHSEIIVCDNSAQTVSVWRDGNVANNSTGMTYSDLAPPANGSAKVTIGGFDTPLTQQYVGEWSVMMYIPAPIFADATARAALLAYIATV